jgi:hypothetical protein
MKIVVLSLFLFVFTFAVKAQGIDGLVSSSADNLPIEGVHIVNITQNQMSISDEKGYFTISVSKGDTLVASNINFNTKQFIVKNETYLKIALTPATIQLDEVRVSNMPNTEAEFRKKLVDMNVIEDNTFVPFGMQPNKPQGKIPKNYDPAYTNSLGYAINKPISFIVKKLSKQHKQKLKYYQTVANQGKVIANDKKYNPEVVKELTGLEGDDLTDFIQFLDLDAAFVQRSSEYEIAAKILKEFDIYKSRKG